LHLGIYVDWLNYSAGNNITIERVTVKESGGLGIVAYAGNANVCSNLNIRHNTVLDSGQHGINVLGNAGGAGGSIDNFDISNNYVNGFSLVIADGPGITGGRNSSSGIISNNRVIGPTLAAAVGAQVHGISLDTSTGVTCVGNTIRGTGVKYGIEVGLSDDCTVSGNTIVGTIGGIVITGTVSPPVICDNVAITGNVCQGMTTFAGIYSVVNGFTTANQLFHTNISITGNTVTGCLLGIYLNNANQATISGNLVAENFYAGIYTLDSKNFHIDGNNVHSNNVAGFQSVTSITLVSSTATVTTAAPHGYITGDVVVIVGAIPERYNNIAAITVTGLSTFTYPVVAGTASPAGGTILVSKINGSAYAGIRIQYSQITDAPSKVQWRSGLNRLAFNGGEFYLVGVNGVDGGINNSFVLKEVAAPLRVENLTSGVVANALDRVGISLMNSKLVFSYNNAGTQNYLSCALDGATTTWVNSATTP
jgi:parallel beta-helix repeat protein